MAKVARELNQIEVDFIRTPGRYAVGGVAGLQLRIVGNSRAYVFRTVVAGRRRDIGLGNADLVTLAQARAAAAEFKHNPARTPNEYRAWVERWSQRR